MANETQDEQLSMVAILARRIADCLPHNDAELAILSHLVGIAYSLRKAIELSPDGYSDKEEHRDFGNRVLSAAKAVDSPVPHFEAAWEAGYYFNSALTRIAAVNDLMRNYAGEQANLSPEDSRNMSRISPEIRETLVVRYVTFDDAAKSAWKLASAFLALLKDSAA